ncbi:MAG: acylneuraminate cytidylyltransferase family protein [SAR324 cluster bacterium]|nr:acylneuraminate cytidylyltransferase family protein [SAR324 cluster bacterium]
MSKKIIALIPARGGSKRVVNKNIRELGGHPLMAYTIAAAKKSGIFSRIIVSTESKKIAEVAQQHGAEVPFLRPDEYAQDHSPDIDWIFHLLNTLHAEKEDYDCFSILRPTSPFRQPETICRAWTAFQEDSGVDSLRAVEKCSQHPAKMWYVQGRRMSSVISNPDPQGTPWHSSPYQSLPEIHVQNASLEIAYCHIPLRQRTIAGKNIMPFITNEYEGFDINLPEDWFLAEYLINHELAHLPEI